MVTDGRRVPRWSWLVAVPGGLAGLGLLARAVTGSGGGVVGRASATAFGVALLGLADLAATGVLARMLAWLRWHENSDRRIALRAYWFVPRKPHLLLGDGLLTLALPGYFGRTRWTVPLDQVAVDALGAPVDDEHDDGDADLVFVDEVAIPYFATTSSVTDGTLLLLFRRPVRVPRLRRVFALSPNPDVGFGYLESRRGVYVDGVYLRPVHAPSAYTRLVGAGAEPAGDPLTWLRAHRRVATGPGERADLLRRARAARRLRRLAGAAVVVAFAVGIVLRVRDTVPTWAVLVEYAGIIAAWWLRRLARRVRRTPGPTGPNGPTAGS